MTEYTVTYAQNREDVILKGFFKDVKKGFYVDVGANHPRNDSVTKIFYDEGWRGINIEPNRMLYKLLQRDRPEDINLQIGVSSKPGKLTLREYPDGHGLSTFSKEMQKSYEKSPSSFTKKHLDYDVNAMPLTDVFMQNKIPDINFMKVDVEGYEYEVLASNDWKKYRPQVLCIESNHIIRDWRPLLKENKYEFVFFDGLNDYYVASEYQETAKKFSYPEALLAKPPIPAEFIEGSKMVEWQLKQGERKLAHQELLNQSLSTELHNVYQLQAQRSRIRSLVKQLLVAVNNAILTHIENLNKPRVRRQDTLRLSGTQASEMLLQIKSYDLNRYYGLTTTKPMSYRIALGSHRLLYKTIKSSLLKMAKLVRKDGHAK